MSDQRSSDYQSLVVNGDFEGRPVSQNLSEHLNDVSQDHELE